MNVSGFGIVSFQGGIEFGGNSGVAEVVREAFEGVRRDGPLSNDKVSRSIWWRRWSCEDMKGAEWRSPVQRVMSTQSRDWLRMVRRWERWGSMRGWDGERERWRCGWVFRRRWSVCFSYVSIVLDLHKLRTPHI